jgi:7-keto-8-aminopelargonate synthetase-like enzyme
MRSQRADQHQRLLKLWERHALTAWRKGLYRARIEDEALSGDRITLRGRSLLNFGSAMYLGLNLDPRLKAAAAQAIEAYGPVYSSSTAYTSVPLYTELEERLSRIFEATVVVPPTTTLAHIAAIPVVVGPRDLVLIDAQAHASLHLATQLVAATGVPVRTLPHNDLVVVEHELAEAEARFDRVWYLADGIYSMYGAVAPVPAIARLLDRYPYLHVYLDDAHGLGWQGRHGRGHVLAQLACHPRMVVVGSLAKSFGSGGAVAAFGDPELARRVTLLGGPMTFSGPVHPAELGASVASADIHLSPEHEKRQRRLYHQIELVRSAAAELRIPLVSHDQSPIWFALVGDAPRAYEVAERMRDRGFYLNIGVFPAVPMGRSGVRFTHTLYLSDDQITAMLEALAATLREVVGDIEVVIDLAALEAADDAVAGF